MTPGVLILGGPTASGKSALALAFARERGDVEIVGADSRQIYAGMPIGTAAPTEEERALVPHHLVAFLDPHERYTAGRFVQDALAAIDAIHARGRRALVVGGTGFYLRALTGGVTLEGERDPDLRARLAHEARLHPPQVLHAWLAVRAPERAAAIEPADTYRVTRALEAVLAPSGNTSRHAPFATLQTRGIAFRKLVLDVPSTQLEARIARRTDAMLAAGLVEEALRIGRDAVAADAVGYPEALAYAAGWSTDEEMRMLLARNTRRYAKRQRTWFRSEPDVRWIDDAGATTAMKQAARELAGWT